MPIKMYNFRIKSGMCKWSIYNMIYPYPSEDFEPNDIGTIVSKSNDIDKRSLGGNGGEFNKSSSGIVTGPIILNLGGRGGGGIEDSPV
jgi:hypothetical protein